MSYGHMSRMIFLLVYLLLSYLILLDLRIGAGREADERGELLTFSCALLRFCWDDCVLWVRLNV